MKWIICGQSTKELYNILIRVWCRLNEITRTCFDGMYSAEVTCSVLGSLDSVYELVYIG